MEEIHKIEAVLFGAGKFLSDEDLARLSGVEPISKVTEHLENLRKEYDTRKSAINIIQEGKSWKMNVKDDFLPLIQSIVTGTELEKPLMETLAVIAWRYPALQSDVIKIRHNKAYEHLSQLEELGFVTRSKHGRSKKITLTQKFFDYFDLPSKEQAQEAFKEVLPEDLRKAIEETERQIIETEKVIEETKANNEESKSQDNTLDAKEKLGKLNTYEDSKEVDLIDQGGKKVELDKYLSKPEVQDYDTNDNGSADEIPDSDEPKDSNEPETNDSTEVDDTEEKQEEEKEENKIVDEDQSEDTKTEINDDKASKDEKNIENRMDKIVDMKKDIEDSENKDATS